jgi:hypothetical protein
VLYPPPNVATIVHDADKEIKLAVKPCEEAVVLKKEDHTKIQGQPSEFLLQ